MPQDKQRGIRVLLIEDNPADARLVREALRGLGGPPFVIVVADRLSAGLTALEKGGFDVALVDLSLPDSHGLQTFLDVRERARSVPVLVLSGLEDEQVASRAVSEGAQDYVYKSQLGGNQLARAILYALSRQQILQQLEESVVELKASEERYKVVTEAAQDAIITVDEADCIVFANSAAERLFGRTKDEMLGEPATGLLPEDSRAAFDAALSAVSRMPAEVLPAEPIALVGRRKDGTRVPLELTFGVTSQGGHRLFTGVLRDVSQRRVAEEEARRVRESLTQAQRIAHVGSWDWDLLRDEVKWSEEMFRILGLDPAESGGDLSKALGLMHPEDRERVADAARKAIEGTRPYDVEYRTVRPDGGVRHLRAMGAVFHDASGRPIRMIGAVYDLTELKQSENALRASELAYRRIVETAQEGVWVTDADSRTAFANRKMAEMLCTTVEALTGASMFDFMDEEARREAQVNVERRKRGIAEQHEFRFRRKDGSALWALVATNPLTDAAGRYEGALAMVVDITRRKEMEEALRKRTEELSALYEGSLELSQTLKLESIYKNIHELVSRVMACDSLFVSSYDEASRLIACEYAVRDGKRIETAGLPPTPLESQGKGTQSVVIRYGRPLLLRDYEKQLSTATTSYHVDDKAPALKEIPPGAPRTRSALLVPLKVEGRVTGVIQVRSHRLDAYSEDDLRVLEAFALHAASALTNAQLFKQAQTELEERRKAEEAVTRSEEKYRQIVETAQEGIHVLDAEGRTTFANRRLAEMLGYAPEELIGVSLYDLLDEKSGTVAREEIASGKPGEGALIEVRMRRKDGSFIWVSAAGNTLFDEAGRRVGALAMVTDISERRAMAQMREEILDVVSHEFRTPVTVIQGYAELMGTGALKPDSPAWHAAREKIERSSKHLGFLLTSIVELSKLREGGRVADLRALKTIDLFTEAATAMDARRPGPSRAITVEVAPGAENVQADHRMLLIALVELLDNAAKYSLPDTPVVIRASTLDGQVLIEVEDRGQGFPENVRKDIFKPFVQADSSSVRKTGGAGLGLAVVNGLVKAQGGRVEVDSEVGKGSTVRIVLPRPAPA